jgi:hypothetical protein
MGIIQSIIEAQEKRMGRRLDENERQKLQKGKASRLLSWLETVFHLSTPANSISPKDSETGTVYKSNIFIQVIFGLFSLAVVVFINLSVIAALNGNPLLLLFFLWRPYSSWLYFCLPRISFPPGHT